MRTIILFFSMLLIPAILCAQKSKTKPEHAKSSMLRKPAKNESEKTTFHAENIPPEHRIILQRIFSLREDSVPAVLELDTILNKVAKRVALANLEREGIIKHTDAEEKALTQRTKEEGYPGRTGEIVSVGFLECLPKNTSEKMLDSMALEAGNDFRNVIRNSPRHYNGLMAKTGTDWSQFGYSIVKKEVLAGKEVMCKYSLCLVLGKHF